MEANAGTPPNHLLGYTIRSRTRIYVSFLIPAAFELLCYISQIVGDSAVSYEHFKNHQADFGWATLSLILVPPVLTFIFVLSSKDQWKNPKHKNGFHFVLFQVLQMLFFPFFAIYRIAARIFWSIESLFHDNNDKERMKCLDKMEESSTCELYHLIQAYGQSAPQIILQLYHMLSQDLFRDFQTTNAQAISLVFSAIDLAAITTAYQRFESQRRVGRSYPWSPPQSIEAQRQILAKNEQLRRECERKKRDSQRTITSFPESEKIMANFKQKIEGEDGEKLSAPRSPTFSEPISHTVLVHGHDEVDDNSPKPTETTFLLHNAPKTASNATDDDKMQVSPKRRFHSIRDEIGNTDDIDILDAVPDCVAPLPPSSPKSKSSFEEHVPQLRTQTSTASNAGTARDTRASKTISQLEKYKDMLIINAQLYIKEHVPRPPKMLISRVDEAQEKEDLCRTEATPPDEPMTPNDVVDFFLPRPTKIVNGIQQDDFVGKTIAFFGWISFVVMRMLSLASFCVFYPDQFLIIVGVHYLVMLVALCLETKFRGKLNRILFYLLLAYVYIFVILEFRVKFKHIRVWIVGYFVVTMTENIILTMIWYAREEFESWWFDFIFEGIIYSGILFVTTLIVYYYILKPKEVTLIVEDENKDD